MKKKTRKITTFSLKIIKKNIKILSPENIYVQLFKIEPPNVKPIGYPNRYLTIR